jgi:LysM repeat protein
MSAVEALPTTPSPVEPATREPRAGALPSLCPYLATLDGNWRSATAVREHRCMAVSPPVQLAAEKQRRLCLVDRHIDCATYSAAIGSRAGTAARTPGHSRPIARMTPVILDHGRFDLRIPAWRADRASGQAILVGVLGLTFVAILLARPSGDAGAIGPLGSDVASTAGTRAGVPTDAAAASPSDGPASTAAPERSDRPAATEAPSRASAPPPSTTPSSPASSATVTSGATYRVKSGDTLSAIAARFGTTTRVLVRLNGIADPSKLKVGQILKLP